MVKKWLLFVFILLLLLLIALGINYRHLYLQYRDLLATNGRLVKELDELRDQAERMRRTMVQIADQQDIGRQLQGTFVDRKAYFRKNWKNFIQASLNDYKTGFLGGIRNLKILVKNQTDYLLDNVMVTLEYVRVNGEVFKAENHVLSNVPAKGMQVLAAADSRRGMKVRLKLRSITSQAMNFCWSADKVVAPGEQDPYQCVPLTRR